ncbi:MAG: hypothetical protein ACYDA1_04385 [Vulcanimicrobiaceae bacterium]
MTTDELAERTMRHLEATASAHASFPNEEPHLVVHEMFPSFFRHDDDPPCTCTQG